MRGHLALWQEMTLRLGMPEGNTAHLTLLGLGLGLKFGKQM